MRKTVTRRYLGMLDTRTGVLKQILTEQDKLPSTEEDTMVLIRHMLNFQNKHLQAYMRGQSVFTWHGDRFEVRQQFGEHK